MMEAKVSGLSFVGMGTGMVFGFLIPVVLIILLRKKYACKMLPFFVGCGTFAVSAIVLESIVHSIVLGGGRGEALMAKPLVYALYGGLMAGLFEETGRFTAYKILLKKNGEYNDDSTALSYGAGHGGFEAFYILVVSMVTNVVLGIMINTGNTELLFNGVDGAKAEAITTLLNKLVTTNPWLFFVSVIERFGAVAFHMAASVLVWFAVKDKGRWYLYPAAIVLHMLLDVIAAFGNSMNMPIWLIEVFIYIYSGLCILLACGVWKKAGIKK